jgi:hypothetical protein
MTKMPAAPLVPQSSAAIISEEGDEALLTQNIDPDEEIEFTDPAAPDENTVDPSNDVISSEDPVARPAVVKPKAKPASVADEDDEFPEELKGKSPAELARMYKEAQRALGRQGTELGELRNLADTHIRSTMAAKLAQKPAAPAAPAAPVQDTDFFADPVKAVSQAIENHPEVQRLRKTNQELQATALKGAMEAAQTKFNAAHPDAADILADPDFQMWVDMSPVRKGLLQQAHHRYNFAAGDEVFSTWKELKASRAPAVDAGKAEAAAKAKAVRSAGRVPTGGNATPKGSTSGEKIYRRADLIKLQMTDPDRYDAMSSEIEAAYRGNRVR